MKRDTLIIVLMATLVASAAYAQQPERRLVKTWREGDYIVERYIVMDSKPHCREYEIHFAINSSWPDDSLTDNSIELNALDGLFRRIESNKTMHLESINIKGYASPDGTTAKNASLAKERADHTAEMIAERYFVDASKIDIDSQVELWSATTAAIEQSPLNNREEIIEVVNSNTTPMSIDYRLKRHANAWDYLTNDILPDMRRAVISVVYTQDHITDTRHYSPEEVVAEKCHKQKPRHETIDEWEGIIIDNGTLCNNN